MTCILLDFLCLFYLSGAMRALSSLSVGWQLIRPVAPKTALEVPGPCVLPTGPAAKLHTWFVLFDVLLWVSLALHYNPLLHCIGILSRTILDLLCAEAPGPCCLWGLLEMRVLFQTVRSCNKACCNIYMCLVAACTHTHVLSCAYVKKSHFGLCTGDIAATRHIFRVGQNPIYLVFIYIHGIFGREITKYSTGASKTWKTINKPQFKLVRGAHNQIFTPMRPKQ
jgi:hypothetical protein